MAATSITRWVKMGRLHRTGYPGVYTVGTPPATPLEHAMAAVLACGDGAVLSHTSALTLWGIWKRWDKPLHLTTPADRRPKGIRVHRVQKLHRRDLACWQGIPCTTLARALLDMAPGMSAKSLVRAINDGRLNGRLHLSALADVVARYPSHPGRKRLERALGRTTTRPTRSSLEDDFPGFCERYGLPQPRMNTEVCGYEVDALFEAEKVIVELDGWDFHRSRGSFESDRDRDADTAAAGFLTIRITTKRFGTTPEKEARRLHVILAQRRPRAA